MGSTETKYFPVHIDYNTMIKIKELNTWETPLWLEKNMKATFFFMVWSISNVTCIFSNGWMGDDSLITKERSYPVERLRCIKARCFFKNHILWICPRWLVKDNDKGPNWLGPSLENHNLLREILHPKSIFWESNTWRLERWGLQFSSLWGACWF